MIYLHKVLPLIISPLFFVILIISLGIILKSKKVSFLGILILIICSLPILSNNLIYHLEKDYQAIDVSKIGDADAVVVLSGMVSTIKKNDNLFYEFNDSIYRILKGVELIKENKASYLILTRGILPWSNGKPEGEVLKYFALKLGIEKEKIILTNNVQNTDQEAKAIKKLFTSDDQKIILITPAFHRQKKKKFLKQLKLKLYHFQLTFGVHQEILPY